MGASEGRSVDHSFLDLDCLPDFHLKPRNNYPASWRKNAFGTENTRKNKRDLGTHTTLHQVTFSRRQQTTQLYLHFQLIPIYIQSTNVHCRVHIPCQQSCTVPVEPRLRLLCS
jgi:hypothetical protein